MLRFNQEYINGIFYFFGLLSVLFVTSSCANQPVSEEFDPNNPFDSGYKLVFGDEFNSSSTIDINRSGAAGFKWYTTPFFVPPSSKTPSIIKVSNGVLTLNSTATSVRNGNIATVASTNSNSQGYIGKVFGGGAYFEARIAFDPTKVNTANGWPSFWSMSIEHIAQKNADQWAGHGAGYSHFIEDDFFEYVTASFAGPNSYGATMHDWYGIYNKTCPPGYCKINNTYGGGSFFKNAVIKTPTNTDWAQFHIIGQLWVPSNGQSKGYVQNYFDGKLMSTVSWVPSISGTSPPSGDFTFSIMDQNHLVVILGTGINQPLHVDWVHIWQKVIDVDLSSQR